MGAYLDKPSTDKVSEDGEGHGFRYGATSMQGWRINQEDAHNCVLGIADEWSLFAVYDGHGGSDVAKYTALNLPDFLKEREFWKQDDLGSALQSVFVDFDDLLRSEKFINEVKAWAKENEGGERNGDRDSEDEADRIETIEESRIPLEQILAKYGCRLIRSGGPFSKVDESGDDSDDEPTGRRARKAKKKRLCKSPAQIEEAKRAKMEKNGTAANSTEQEKNDKDAAEQDEQKQTQVAEAEKIPDGGSDSVDTGDVPESSDPMPGASGNEVEPQPGSSSAVEIPSDVEVEFSDSEDSSFQADEDEEEEEEDDEDEDDEDEENKNIFFRGGTETPGEDSGSTACVCLISKTKVVVANAGDSRAVLSRAGKAIELSVDHKPEDESELSRITRAGGQVTADGRVNGGLNLSRAFGDHCYKKNTELPLADQMISALPDVKIEDLNSEDEFVVVACDGIWNSMDSQQVVDFVRNQRSEGKTCKEIAEALCDHCLAPDTTGDGTGCDNMTVIVAEILH